MQKSKSTDLTKGLPSSPLSKTDLQTKSLILKFTLTFEANLFKVVKKQLKIDTKK